MAQKKTKQKVKSKVPILKSRDLPVTQAMLKSSLNSLEKRQDSRFSQIDSRFSQIDSRFSQIDSRFSQIDSKIELVLSEIHRMAVLMEEQNSRNKFVLDGYASLYERQERVELRLNAHIQDIEKLILSRNEIIK